MSRNGDWWKKINNLYPRNPEAFKTDGGAIWTTGEKENIFKDEYFYTPETFDWLGSEFKGIKSLVSGIGLKITDISGEKFNKNMTGISFGESRKNSRVENKRLGQDVLTRRVSLERVAYYKTNGGIWELGRGTCAIKHNEKGQDVYLFVGVAEVKVKGEQDGRGYEWNFQKDKFFNDDYNCGILIGKGSGSKYRLVVDRIGRKGTRDGNQGDRVILLGAETRGIMNFGNSRRNNPLIGVLMGVAVNLAQSKDCNSAFGMRVEGGERFNEIKNCLEKVERKVTNERRGGLKISGDDKKDTSISEDWVIGELKEGLSGWKKISKLSTWTDGTELAYEYK